MSYNEGRRRAKRKSEVRSDISLRLIGITPYPIYTRFNDLVGSYDGIRSSIDTYFYLQFISPWYLGWVDGVDKSYELGDDVTSIYREAIQKLGYGWPLKEHTHYFEDKRYYTEKESNIIRRYLTLEELEFLDGISMIRERALTLEEEKKKAMFNMMMLFVDGGISIRYVSYDTYGLIYFVDMTETMALVFLYPSGGDISVDTLADMFEGPDSYELVRLKLYRDNMRYGEELSKGFNYRYDGGDVRSLRKYFDGYFRF